MKPWSGTFAGRFEEHELESQTLVGNPLGVGYLAERRSPRP